MYQTSEHSGSNWNLKVLVFRRGENRSTNFLEQSREPTTNSTPHDNAESGNRTPGHIGVDHHPCSQKIKTKYSDLTRLEPINKRGNARKMPE